MSNLKKKWKESEEAYESTKTNVNLTDVENGEENDQRNKEKRGVISQSTT